MNERIKLLAKQVGIIGQSENSIAPSLEKFADLIVQEMLKTCAEHPAWYGRMIADEIKQNFGVKE